MNRHKLKISKTPGNANEGWSGKGKEDHKETNNNYIALLKKFMEPVIPKDEVPPIWLSLRPRLLRKINW